MASVSVRSRNIYTYSSVKSIGNITSDILNEIYIPNDFIRRIEVAERVNAKFVKPVNQSEDTLYIYSGGWRLVAQERDKKVIGPTICMYGKSIDTKDNNILYAPSKNASYLVKTPEGDVIAELIEGKLLNILFNIFDCDRSDKIFLLRNLMMDLITNHFGYNLEELKKAREEEEKNSVANFLTMLASREFEVAEREVSRIKSRILDYEETLKRLYKERRAAMAKAEGFRIQSMLGATTIKAELDKVRNISSIKNILVDGMSQEIIFQTNDIYINNAGKRYYIGEFDIRINPIESRVIFNNKNNCRRSYWGSQCHHPHVDQGGSPCWGNVSTAVRAYIEQNEFQALATLLIGYLESVNTTDAAGKHITSWDVVNKAGEVVQEGYYYANPPANSETYVCNHCQDVFNREGIVMRRGDVHICTNCAHDYFICPDCGDIHKLEDAEECEKCGCDICEDCYDDGTICNACIEADKVAAQLAEPGAVLCQYCNTVIHEDELHTCETCGEQGCGECITFDGRYSCPNHRE